MVTFLLLWAASIEDAVGLVHADRIREYAAYLASDELQGRLAGHPGNDRAAEYIADHFRAIGLEPCGDRDPNGEPTYFQAFNLPRGAGRTRNIVGLLPGRDPDLRGEIVVIGAHMDHVGTADQQPNVGRRPPARNQDPDDHIWNGADDNASGTSTVMEIARAWMASHYRPRRSVLFILFSAEEWGLLGSRHYVQQPLFPREQHVAMINLDMVGRNPDGPLLVGGCGTAEPWEELARAAAEGLALRLRLSRGVNGGSDHYSFATENIPALHLFTNFHEEYHRPADHADLLAIDHMGEIAKFALRLAAAVADRDERLQFVEGSVERPDAPRTRRVLGISGSPLAEDELDALGLAGDAGGIHIDNVEEGSLAASAGIRTGDVLIEFNGSPLSRAAPLTSLRRLIRQAPAERDVPAVVIRDDQRLTVRVRFPE